MNSTATPYGIESASLWSQRSLHICVLSAFAFSEPIFTVLGQQFVFLHDLQAGWTEIAVMVLIMTALLPGACVLADQLLLRYLPRWCRWGRDGVFVLLACIVCLSILRPFLRIEYLVQNSSVWLVTLAMAITTSLLLRRMYYRSAWIRSWVSVATIGLVCFPGLFVYQFGQLKRQDSLQKKEAWEHRISVENPVPVVFVVFDEFSGTSLMDRDLEIDGAHFPHFKRLREISTWYRNASTVHGRTDVAVPAILSGQFPTVKRPPLESEYPGNLLQTIYKTAAYDMVVFEPVTRLCPPAARQRPIPARSFIEKMNYLTTTLASVYPRLIFPDDMPIDFPPISKVWFGLPEKLTNEEHLRHGLIRHLPFYRRDDQLSQFIECIGASDRPQFLFLHVELPHLPWYFLPSGHYYNYERGFDFQPPGSWGDVGEEWGSDARMVARSEHRYLMQLGFVDHFIGRLLDRLQATELLEKCLLIVTADHGASFRPGHSRRTPDAQTLPDIASVPLFVKLPGQTSGEVSDRNVESIDILPTIAETLGMPLSERVDGNSVTDDRGRLRKSFYVDDSMKVLEPSIPHLKSAVQRRLDLYGDASWERPPPFSAIHLDWHGRSIEEFIVEQTPLPGVLTDVPLPSRDVGSSEFSPCLVWGYLDPKYLPNPPADLVVAVNGVIRDSGYSCSCSYGAHRFDFLLPETYADETSGKIEVFLVVPGSVGKARLKPVASWKLPIDRRIPWRTQASP